MDNKLIAAGILNKIFHIDLYQAPDSLPVGKIIHERIKEEVLLAMQEYAEIISIGFAEWKDDNEGGLVYGLGFSPTIKEMYDFWAIDKPIEQPF